LIACKGNNDDGKTSTETFCVDGALYSSVFDSDCGVVDQRAFRWLGYNQAAIEAGGWCYSDDSGRASSCSVSSYLSCDPPKAAASESEYPLCCFEVTCETCGAYGRPFRVDGPAVHATAVERGDWLAGLPVLPALEELSEEERALLAHRWTEDALAEHSSVAGFHRFALDLMAHGAPASLVERAQQAAVQEARHARLCFSLASAYAGQSLGPSRLPLHGEAPVAEDLVQLAVWTARDGAIGETISAWLAAEALRQATDPAVVAVLEEVVADEQAHAELAWATLRWAVAVGGSDVVEALRPMFSTRLAPTTAAALATARTRAHGVLSPEDMEREARRCITEIIQPVAASLLARPTVALGRQPRSEPTAPA
jgi:hypothetical protein